MDLETDTDKLMQMFGEEWVLTLARDDVQALPIFVRCAFVSKLGVPILTEARATGELLGRNERTICVWWSGFHQQLYFSWHSSRCLPAKQCFWSKEELNERM